MNNTEKDGAATFMGRLGAIVIALICLFAVLGFLVVIGAAHQTYGGLTAYQWSQVAREESQTEQHLISELNNSDEVLAGCEHRVVCPLASPGRLITEETTTLDVDGYGANIANQKEFMDLIK